MTGSEYGCGIKPPEPTAGYVAYINKYSTRNTRLASGYSDLSIYEVINEQRYRIFALPVYSWIGRNTDPSMAIAMDTDSKGRAWRYMAPHPIYGNSTRGWIFDSANIDAAKEQRLAKASKALKAPTQDQNKAAQVALTNKYKSKKLGTKNSAVQVKNI